MDDIPAASSADSTAPESTDVSKKGSAAPGDQSAEFAIDRRSGPARIVDRHKYRDEIVELLAAGWAPKTLNMMLSRLHRDYEPVNERTLREYRQDCIDQKLRRPLEEYAKKLKDQHALLDPITSLAALITVQEGRVQKALALENRLEGMVLPAAGAEIERLARLWHEYREALRELGFGQPGGPEMPGVERPTQVNVLQVFEAEMAGLPEEHRQMLAETLEKIRAARAEARMAEVRKKIAARMPLPQAEGNGSGAREVARVIEPPSPSDGDDAGAAGRDEQREPKLTPWAKKSPAPWG